MPEYPKKKQIVIDITYGSDYQEELHEQYLTVVLDVLKNAMEGNSVFLGNKTSASHKKNNLEYKIVDNN